MKQNARWLTALSVAVALFGCNAIQAKPDAEAVVGDLFDARRQGDRASVLPLYHPAFYEATPRETWSSMLDSLQSKLGSPAEETLDTWNVTVGTGDVGVGTYVTLVYQVEYAAASGTETLVLFSPAAGTRPGIIAHNINSDALLLQ